MAFDEDSYRIGTATQFFGVTPEWADPYASLYPTSQPLPQGGEDIDKLLAEATALPQADYSNEGRNYPTPESTQGPGGSPINASMALADSGIANFIKNLLSGKGTTAQNLTALAGLGGLLEYLNRDKPPTGWQGTLQKGTYTAPTASKEYYDAIMSRGYGQRAMGMNPFAGRGVYTPAAASAAPTTPTVQVPEEPTQEISAADGGLMGYARGGKAMPPRYLRGQTDGMADKIPSNIDGVQPAKLSHGEFVIPADVVSHLGNGNSDAGAKVLYKMMDRVRKARTGNKKQGRRINPEKFTPGGIAGYAGGGAVAFQTGGATPNVSAGPVSSAGGLSSWVGDYVAGPQGFLSKAWALGDKPYEAYQGPLTAGTSPLQQQAYQGLSSLGTPGQFDTAARLATQAGQAAGNINYAPTAFSAPTINTGAISAGYNAPAAYQTGVFDTGLGGVRSVEEYMSPYQQGVINIQAREARRQADIARQSEQARLAQAGAYGGSRQAIMEAERQRNLGQQIGDIQEKGLQSAYDRAMQQRMDTARLSLDAQKAQELSRQFGYGQQMTAAQLQAQFGLDAQKANQLAELQAATANQRAAMEAQEMGEKSRQFGANLGLQGIGQQLAAAGQLGSLGTQQFGTQLQGLNALLGAGREQQATEQAAVDAQMRQFQEAQKYPYAQLEFQRSMLQGLPVGTSTTSQATSGFSDLLGGVGGLLGLYERLGKVGG